MADNLLDQVVFGTYEVFANIIPGTIVTVTGVLLVNRTTQFREFMEFPESLVIVMLFFLAFILGQAIQALSAVLEKLINKKMYDGYPSSLYLENDNPTFPKYFKDRIRQLVNRRFDTPLDASPQHVFDFAIPMLYRRMSVREFCSSFIRTHLRET